MNKNVFIAMPFNHAFDNVYKDAILPTLLKFNFEPYRVDEFKIDNSIIIDIEEGIRNSLFMIADCTDKSSNVFYEIGFAKALGKKVIAITQNLDDIPFNLKNRRLIMYSNTDVGLLNLKNLLIEWINEILKNPFNITPNVYVHGTKFTVPNGNEFWNDLCRKAEKKFYLLGESNKSWVNKSDEQSRVLSASIVRIISNNGIVRIISDSQSNTIGTHFEFYSKYLKPLIKGNSLISKFKKNFTYGIVEHSNYKAIISDNRIVLLPSMNSLQFRDEALVMELQGSHLPYFQNYLADVERLLKESKCKIIDLSEYEQFT